MSTKWLLLVFAAPAFAQPGSISGTVTSAESGAALAGVHLVAAAQRTNGAPILLEANSSDDGRYSIANVPPGDYTICAQYKPAPALGSRRDLWQMGAGIDSEIAYLDPCDWSDGVHARVDTSAVALDIGLERGVNLTVLVDGSAAALQIFVRDGSGAIRASLHAQTDSNVPRRYRAVVPRSGRYRLVVHAHGAQIEGHPEDFELPVETAPWWRVAARFKLR